MKKDKISKWMLVTVLLSNMFNVLDIVTTRIVTNDWQEMGYEANQWLVYNVQGGYLGAMNFMKIIIIALYSIMLYFVSENLKYYGNKARSLRIFLLFVAFVNTFYWIGIVINNTIVIISL